MPSSTMMCFITNIYYVYSNDVLTTMPAKLYRHIPKISANFILFHLHSISLSDPMCLKHGRERSGWLLFLHQYFTDNDATLACTTSRRTREGVITRIKESVATREKRPHCELAAQGGAPDLLFSGAAKPWVAVSSVVSISHTSAHVHRKHWA
jgi:hypothetical protein